MSTNKIFMEARFDISFKEPVSEIIGEFIIKIKDHIILEVGGFDFIIKEKLFPFDFESWSAKVTDIDCVNNTISIDYSSGYGGLVECDTIDFDIYEKYYEENGFNKDDINAGILASTSEISEFCVYVAKVGSECDELIHHIKINDICFIDENMISHYVSKSVIDNFNAKEKIKNG